MDIIKKLRYILDRKQKIHICFLGVMIFIGGILETLSVSAILPIVWVIMDPVQAQENEYMQKVTLVILRRLVVAYSLFNATRFLRWVPVVLWKIYCI